MAVRNFAHHAKPLEAAKDFAHHAKFCMVCKIFLSTDSVRFLSLDILCNFLVSPCNQPRYFLIYLFIYLLGSLYIKRETGWCCYVCFSLNTCKFPVVRNIQSFCSTLPSYFVFTFLSSQATSEDEFSGDEWLNFTFLGVMEARWRTWMQRWELSLL